MPLPFGTPNPTGVFVLLGKSTNADAGASATLTVSGIPASATHLKIVGMVRSDGALTFTPLNCYYGYGSGPSYDSGANYGFSSNIVNSGVNVVGQNASLNQAYCADVVAATGSTAGFFTTFEMIIPRYATTGIARCATSSFCAIPSVASTTSRMGTIAHVWGNTTDAITGLSFFMGTGNFVQGSKIYVYGIL